MKTFTIGTNDANQRFDKYLKKLLPNASVSFLYKMLRKKNITLDGKKATGKETLQKGAQGCNSRVLGAAATNEMGFRNTKTVSRLLCYPTMLQEFPKQRKWIYERPTE